MKELPESIYCPAVVVWGYPSKSIKAEVLFGTPGKDCRGIGICSVTANGAFQSEKYNCKSAPVEISMTENKKLQLRFPMASLCQRIRKKHFRYGFFRIAEDFWMPDFINRPLGLKSAYRIKPGKYKVYENTKYYTVKF